MKVDILGIGFDKITMNEAIGRAISFIGDRRPHYIVTPNPEITYNSLKDSELRQSVQEADLVLPDGVGIVWASRKLNDPLPERVAGFDFAEALLPLLAQHNKRLYLLGAKPGIADKAAERLRLKYPKLNICGSCHGYFADNDKLLDDIVFSKTDVLFVCLGSPKQEKWMMNNVGGVGNALMIGLGGCLDVWAGTLKRAPGIFIALGLEWLYRLIRQPSRIGRILVIPKFMRAVRCQKKNNRRPYVR